MLKDEMVLGKDGVTRCNRVIMQAVPNILGDPGKGYHNVQSYCGMPITTRMSDGVKGCPRCDKEPPVGNVHPRTTNSAGIVLSQKELDECGVKEDTSVKPVISLRSMKKQAKEKKAVEAKVIKKKDTVTIDVDLSTLESAEDIGATLISKVSTALDSLPVKDFGESKRLIRLQEKLENLLKV